MDKLEARNFWLFLFIAFAITWVIGIPLAVTNPPDAEPDPFEISQLGALGPAIAGLIVIYREKGKDGLQAFFGRITKWHIGKKWYLAILFVPLIWLGILPAIIVYIFQHGSLTSFVGPGYGAPPWKDAWWFFLYIMVIGGGKKNLAGAVIFCQDYKQNIMQWFQVCLLGLFGARGIFHSFLSRDPVCTGYLFCST